MLMSVYYKDDAKQFRQAVQSMLDQTIRPSDFVIVCDGPLPEALDQVIQHFEKVQPELFQIIREEENRGFGAALCKGLPQCKYEYVARMDSDDIADPKRMERELRAMELYPNISVVGGQIEEFQDTPDHSVGLRIVPQTHTEIVKMAKKRNPMNHVTVLLRKTDVLECGSYLPLEKFEDYYLWTRMMLAGKQFYNILDVCVYVRVDQQTYVRRGGIRYYCDTLRLERKLLESHFITPFQWFINIVVRFFGTVCINDSARVCFYRRFLRTKPSEKQKEPEK